MKEIEKVLLFLEKNKISCQINEISGNRICFLSTEDNGYKIKEFVDSNKLSYSRVHYLTLEEFPPKVMFNGFKVLDL